MVTSPNTTMTLRLSNVRNSYMVAVEEAPTVMTRLRSAKEAANRLSLANPLPNQLSIHALQHPKDTTKRAKLGSAVSSCIEDVEAERIDTKRTARRAAFRLFATREWQFINYQI